MSVLVSTAVVELGIDLVDWVLSLPPLAGDDSPMPFASGCELARLPGAIPFASVTQLRPRVGAGGEDAHPEYREAFNRLESLLALGRDCGALVEAEAAELRREVARAMNAGIYQDGDRFFCVFEERPTRGAVRAWLDGLANEVGRRCGKQHQGELAAVIATAGAPLDRPSTASAPRFWWLVAVLVAGGLFLLKRGAR